MENVNETKENPQQISGCFKVFFVAVIIFAIYIFFFYNSKPSESSASSDLNPCLMSEDFIKQDLNYPEEADFPLLDCNSTDKGNGNYTVLRKISAKNAFGVEKKYIYKVEMRYKGGVSVDISNWEMVSLRSEVSK